MTNTHPRNFLAVILAMVAVVLAASLTASAQTTSVSLRASGVSPAGVPVSLGSHDTPTGVCTTVFTSANNASVWPGNDLRLTANGGAVTLHGVEDAAGIVVTSDQTLELTGTVLVEIIPGANFGDELGKYSIEGELRFTCQPVISTTTSTASPTPEPPATSTTTAQPPTTTLPLVDPPPVAPPATPVVTTPELTG